MRNEERGRNMTIPVTEGHPYVSAANDLRPKGYYASAASTTYHIAPGRTALWYA